MSKVKTKWIEDQAVTEDKLNSSVAGSGLAGGEGTSLSVDVSPLTEETSPAEDDVFLMERDSDGALRKVKRSNMGGPLSKLFQGTDIIGGLSITASFQAVDLGSEEIKDSYYSHSTSVDPSEITILTAGWYDIEAVITARTVSATGAQRGSPEMKLQYYRGAAWNDIEGISAEYIREDSAKSLSASMSIPTFFEFEANDKLRIVVADLTGSPLTDAETRARGSRLKLTFIDRTGSASGVVANLKDIGDVDAAAPGNRDLLRFNSTSSEWEAYQDIIPELSPYQVTADWAPTWAQIAANGSVILVSTIGGDVTVTLPAAATVPQDGLIHRVWVHHIRGENTCTIEIDGEDFFDGLVDCHPSVGATVTMGVMYMGSGNPGWLRISHLRTVTQVRRAATWAASNFSSAVGIPFDALNIEDNSHVSAWGSPSNVSRINIGFEGRYGVHYIINVDSTGGSTWNLDAWIRVNGAKEIPGTRIRTGNYGGEDNAISLPHVDTLLVVGDYVELVVQHTSLTGNLYSAMLNIDIKV